MACIMGWVAAFVLFVFAVPLAVAAYRSRQRVRGLEIQHAELLAEHHRRKQEWDDMRVKSLQQVDALAGRNQMLQLEVAELRTQVAAARGMNKKLKRRLLQVVPLRKVGTAQELTQSGLPGEVVTALARAPVDAPTRSRLTQYAEVLLVAEGWPDDPRAATRVAQRISAGEEGPGFGDDIG